MSGSALADLDGEPCVEAVAGRLEDLRLLVTERRLEAELGRGRHADVLGELRDLVRDHPLRESGHALLMRPARRRGHQAEALEAYRSARESLVEELGIEPGPALQELHGRMLHQDPTLLAGTAGGEDVSAYVSAVTSRLGSILVFALDPSSLDLLSALAEPAGAQAGTRDHHGRDGGQGGPARADWSRAGDAPGAFCRAGHRGSGSGVHLADPRGRRGTAGERAQADLLLVDAPDGLLEDA